MPLVTDEELDQIVRSCSQDVRAALRLLIQGFKQQIEMWVFSKEPMEKIQFDESMHVVNGPGYNLIRQPLELAAVAPDVVQAILTSVYRDWMFAVDLQQPQVARQILEVSPKQFQSIHLAHVCVRWWWPLLKQLTAIRWQKVREMVRVRPFGFYWLGLMQKRICAEGGRGRSDDLKSFQEECHPIS